jgi:hypothetical protein
MNEAAAAGYKPNDNFEWLPYIEAQAHTGNLDAAEKMSIELLQREKRIDKGLCQLWKRIEAQALAGSDKEFQVHSILSKLSCKP